MVSFIVFSRWQLGHKACKLSISLEPPYCSRFIWSTSNVAGRTSWHSRHFHPCFDATYFFLLSETDRFVFALSAAGVVGPPPLNKGEESAADEEEEEEEDAAADKLVIIGSMIDLTFLSTGRYLIYSFVERIISCVPRGFVLNIQQITKNPKTTPPIWQYFL